MPKVAAQLGSKELDKAIADARAAMAESGQTHAKRIPVGGRPPGLMLQVTPAGSTTWLFRAVMGGQRRERGLGPYNAAGRDGLSLAGARKVAAEIRAGRDPIADRRGTERAVTFKDMADEFLRVNKDGWKNDKHKAQWESTLATWVFPQIGNKPVATLDRNSIEAVLLQPVAKAGGKPLWLTLHETATRVRQRIEKVFDYAIARDHRTASNPAAWRGCLQTIMPAVPKAVKRGKHHAALAYADCPAFIRDLRGMAGTAAKALEFVILTAARSGEVRMADWSEIDLDAAIWNVPADRMKAGKNHEVALSERALAILTATPEAARTGLVFPGSKPKKPFSDMTLAAVLKRMERNEITVHGFRSTFREWAGSETGHPREVIEHALAHQLKDKAEAAYQRSTLLPKRIRLMADWAGYLDGHSGGNVVSIKGAA